MKKLVSLFALAALAAIVPAHASDPNAVGLHWSDPHPFGGGSARVWVAVDVDGATQSVGVSLDEAATTSSPGTGPEEALLPLPEGVAIAGAAGSARPAFRVKYDPVSRGTLVMLEGLPANAPAAVATRAR